MQVFGRRDDGLTTRLWRPAAEKRQGTKSRWTLFLFARFQCQAMAQRKFDSRGERNIYDVVNDPLAQAVHIITRI